MVSGRGVFLAGEGRRLGDTTASASNGFHRIQTRPWMDTRFHIVFRFMHEGGGGIERGSRVKDERERERKPARRRQEEARRNKGRCSSCTDRCEVARPDLAPVPMPRLPFLSALTPWRKVLLYSLQPSSKVSPGALVGEHIRVLGPNRVPLHYESATAPNERLWCVHTSLG